MTARDHDVNLESTKVREKRADIPTRTVAAGADLWQTGDVVQLNEAMLPPPKSHRLKTP